VNKGNSYGNGFNGQGGGIYVTERFNDGVKVGLKRMDSYQKAFFSDFVLRQSRKDALLCGIAATEK
jgi:hypothetical protein